MGKYHAYKRDWPRIRREVKDRDGWRCRKCGKAGRLEVHHKVAVRDGGDDHPNNLETLCLDCHYAVHHSVTPQRQAWKNAVLELASGSV